MLLEVTARFSTFSFFLARAGGISEQPAVFCGHRSVSGQVCSFNDPPPDRSVSEPGTLALPSEARRSGCVRVCACACARVCECVCFSYLLSVRVTACVLGWPFGAASFKETDLNHVRTAIPKDSPFSH